MKLNIPDIQQKLANVITDLGVKATFTRLGSKIGSGNVVITKTEKDESSNTDEVLKTMFLSNTVKFVPKVGDDVTLNRKTYHINEVAEYAPSDVVIAYKMVVV
jgi:hypothetical protein